MSDTVARATSGIHVGRPEIAVGVIALAAIFLQKLGFNIGDGSIGIDGFILWGALICLLAQGQAYISPLRAFLFASMLCAVMLGLILGEGITSYPALGVFLFMYSTMLVRIDVSPVLLRRCLSPFRFGMTVIAFVVIGQQIVQYTIGSQYWPNLNHIVPKQFLVGGYAYIRPYEWNSHFLTPNGIFFLEPSAVSAFLALALAAEITWFKNLRRLGLFVVAMLADGAGTGPVIIALSSPLLMLQMDRRLWKWAVSAAVPLLIVAALAGAFSHLVSRSSEFHNDNSSAYARFVDPFVATMTLAANPDYLVTGQGPGTSSRENVQWPANKLIYEYGLATAILFHVFLLVAILGSPASRTLALIVLVPHLFFGGGFVSHTNIMMLVLFGSLLRVRPGADHAGLPTAASRRVDHFPRVAFGPAREISA